MDGLEILLLQTEQTTWIMQEKPFHMNSKVLTIAAFFLVIVYMAKAQDCSSSFFPSKEGTRVEMTSYDKKGKETGNSVTILTSVRKDGSMTEYTLKSETKDSKGKTNTIDFTATCDGNNVAVSMKSFFPSEVQKSSDGGEMNIEGTNLNFPNSISVGQKLNDGNVTMTISVGPMTMKTVMNIVNRTVTGKESIKTLTGTYDCYKIEYDVETTMMNIKSKGKVRQWIAKEVGTVKSENYNEKGDLMGYSQLTSIK